MTGKEHIRLLNLAPIVERSAIGDLSLAVAFSEDGHFLAAGEVSGKLDIWKLTNLEQVTSISLREGPIRALAWAADGRKLASGARDQLLRLWEFPSGKLFATYRGHRGSVAAIAFSPDGRRLATCSADGTVRLWDATQPPPPSKNLSTLPDVFAEPRHGAWVLCGRAVLDREWIDLRTMQRTPIPVPAELCSTNTIVRAINDGFLVFGPEAEERRFDRSGQRMGPVTPVPRWPLAMLVTSPDGHWVACGTNIHESAASEFWQAGSSNAPTPFGPPGTTWLLPTFSPDNRLLAAITLGGEVTIWNLAERRVARRFKAMHGVPTFLAFSPDGRLLVPADDGTVKVWDPSAWDRPPMALSAGVETVWSVVASPDGRRLAGGGDDGNVFLWDLSTQQIVCRLKTAGSGLVSAVGFSPSGEDLVALEGSQLYVWHAPAPLSPSTALAR
jgi:WD40 repeat protein